MKKPIKKRSASWRDNLIRKAQQHPEWWIQEVLGASLWEKQIEICKALVNHERVAVPAAFGIGKTHVAARLVLWFLYNFKPSKIITTAPCFDDQTEILTDSGWKLFRDLQRTEKVASLEDGKLRFVYPQDYMDYEVEGELVGYRSRDVDFLITPHHKCYMQRLSRDEFELVRADEAYGKWDWRFSREIVWEGVDDEWTERHYEFFGMWFADGSAGYNEQRRSYSITVTQAKYIEYVRELMGVWGLHVGELLRPGNKSPGSDNICRDGYNFSIYSKNLAKFFIDNFGRLKQDRRIPVWIKNAPPHKLRAFIHGFMMGDGTYAKSSNASSRVKVYGNEGLVDDLQEIGLKAGFVVNKRYQPKPEGNIRDSWALTFLSENGSKTKKHPATNKAHWYREQYAGHVYCVKVPSGVVLVRRNGVYHWSGNTGRQVKDLLWKELRSAHTKAEMKLGGEPLTLSLTLNDEQFAVGFSTDDTNMDMFTGYHSPNQMVVFDQAGGIPPLIWDAAEGLMTSGHCRWLAISNTAISDCEFANICMPERRSKHGEWHIIPITAHETPNVKAGRNVIPGLIAYDWVEKRRRAWGQDDPLYQIFVEARFVPTAQMLVIPYPYLLRAYDYEGRDSDVIEIGLDVATVGLDSTVWFARSGERALEIKRMTGNDEMGVAGETIEFVRYIEQKYQKPVHQIKVDVIGPGGGVYSRLIEQNVPVVPVNNAEVKIVIDRERYSNVRAEMAWALRHRFEHGGVGLAAVQTLDYDVMDMLKADLQIMKYKITSAGKIQILAKDEIREDLGRSPDYWDAMVMAYENPGGGPPMVEFMSGRDEVHGNVITSRVLTDDEWRAFIGQQVDIDDPTFHEVM